jgi:predicted nucleic-acid-binding protein
VIALDTNVLLRIWVSDDPAQSDAARRFVLEKCSPSQPCWANRVAVCEMVWVMERRFRLERRQIADIVAQMLATRELTLENAAEVVPALDRYRRGRGFADSLVAIVNKTCGCSATATFDRGVGRDPDFVPIG